MPPKRVPIVSTGRLNSATMIVPSTSATIGEGSFCAQVFGRTRSAAPSRPQRQRDDVHGAGRLRDGLQFVEEIGGIVAICRPKNS